MARHNITGAATLFFPEGVGGQGYCGCGEQCRAVSLHAYEHVQELLRATKAFFDLQLRKYTQLVYRMINAGEPSLFAHHC